MAQKHHSLHTLRKVITKGLLLNVYHKMFITKLMSQMVYLLIPVTNRTSYNSSHSSAMVNRLCEIVCYLITKLMFRNGHT